MRIDLTQSINATPEAVWPWLTEPELMKEWMTGFVNSVATNEVEGVGATWKMSIQEGRRVSEYDGEITAYDPPNHIDLALAPQRQGAVEQA